MVKMVLLLFQHFLFLWIALLLSNVEGKPVAENQCRNLTRDDAPDNGVLVCHWYNRENSQRCIIKCNPGFEYPTRADNYVTCGPKTGYIWTYQNSNPQARLKPCIRIYIPVSTFQINSAYFTSVCWNFTEAQKKAAEEKFSDLVYADGICLKGTTRNCLIKVGIICGRTSQLNIMAGIEYTEYSVDFTFSLTALQPEVNTTECATRICPMIRIPSRYCQRLCKPTFRRYLHAVALYSKRKLQDLYSDSDKLQGLVLQVQNLEFVPKPVGFNSSDAIGNPCPEGMIMVDGLCACPEGTFGRLCNHRCNCTRGTCSPSDGLCMCPPGLEGDQCEIDINGCVAHSCYPGVACIDQLAPSTGYTCGPCPPGYHGNGITCNPIQQE